MTTDKTPFPSDAADKFVVRFPEGMRDQIAEAAKAAGRSMNAEIVHRLDTTFTRTHASQMRDVASDEVAALRREIEHLQARLQAAGDITKVVETTQALLAISLRNAIERMPEQLRKEHATIHQLANSILHGDVRGMGTAFARILEADEDLALGAKEAADLRQFMEDMEPAIAAKERGEDLEPYRKADFDKMRDRLDATITDPNRELTAASRTKRAALAKVPDSKKR